MQAFVTHSFISEQVLHLILETQIQIIYVTSIITVRTFSLFAIHDAVCAMVDSFLGSFFPSFVISFSLKQKQTKNSLTSSYPCSFKSNCTSFQLFCHKVVKTSTSTSSFRERKNSFFPYSKTSSNVLTDAPL